MSEERRDGADRAFEAGLFVAGQEHITDLHARLVETKKKALGVTLEALDFADEHQRPEQDHIRAAVLDSYRDVVAGMGDVLMGLFAGGGGGGEPEPARPFVRPSTDSRGSGTPSESSLPGRDETMALPGSPPQLPAQPVKRGRGRPRKHPMPTPPHSTSPPGPGSPGGPDSAG